MNSHERDDLFKRLYEKYYRRLIRFFVVVFRLQESDAEELAQDAFLKFYDAIEEYRGDAEWAFFERIARNVLLNKIRAQNTIRRGAVRPVDLDDPFVKKHEPAAPPVDFAERQQQEMRLKRLRQAITQLPPGQRQCIQLWLEERSFKQIATILHISVDAVKARLRDARRALRERLGAEGELPEDER